MKAIIVAVGLLVAFPAVAAQRWPKEIVDSALAHCSAMMANDTTRPALSKVQVDTYCGCLVNGVQGALSIEDFQQMMTLPPDQAAQRPAGRVVKGVVEQCSGK